MTRTVVLDNEAAQALIDPGHHKHRAALAVVEATAARNRRRAGAARLVVPTTVRVEAGWDRRAPASATINRLRITDADLDQDTADQAVPLRLRLGVSVADAHLGAVMAVAEPRTVVTSDTDDLRRIADELEVEITIVRL